MKITDVNKLNEIKNVALNEIKNSKCRVLICAGTGCLAGGSGKIYERINELVKEDLNVEVKLEAHVEHGNIGVKKSGCHGFCEMGPLMRIEPLGILYTKVKLADCEEIYEKTIKNGEIIERLLYSQNGIKYEKQENFGYDALNDRYCNLLDSGIIDPTKVTRSALVSAGSVAYTMLTTEVLVVEDKPEKQ